jgi:LysM repeat protein
VKQSAWVRTRRSPLARPVLGVVLTVTMLLFGAAEARTLHAPVDSGYQVYEVQRGDTLSNIAQRYHIDQASLQKVNGLTGSNIIWPGQILRLPPGTSASSPDRASPSAPPSTAPTPLPEGASNPASNASETATPAPPMPTPGVGSVKQPLHSSTNHPIRGRTRSFTNIVIVLALCVGGVLAGLALGVRIRRQTPAAPGAASVRQSNEPSRNGPVPANGRGTGSSGARYGGSEIPASKARVPHYIESPLTPDRVDVAGRSSLPSHESPRPLTSAASLLTPPPPPHPLGGQGSIRGIVRTDVAPIGFVEAEGVWWETESIVEGGFARGSEVLLKVNEQGRLVAIQSAEGVI